MKNVLDTSKIIKLHAFLAQCCRAGDSGMALYDEGWDDERVLAEFKEFKISISHVRNIRQKMFGRVRSVTSPTAKLDDRIAALEERVRALEDRAFGGRPRSIPPAPLLEVKK